MSKSTDVVLNVKMRNLAGKTLDEINSQVEQLAKNNDAQATSADKAARSMRDLNDTSRQLAGAYRELGRREGITRAFIEQRKEIGATAAKLQELTAKYREMQKGSGGTLIGFSDADVKKVGREIIQVERDLTRMVASNQKAGESLTKMGVDANDAAGSLAKLQRDVARAGDAYKASEAAIEGYSATQKRAADIAAEAARRQAQANKEMKAARADSVRAIGRAGEVSEMRSEIEARFKLRDAVAEQAVAERRLAETRQRAGRAGELAAMRAEIEARSRASAAAEAHAEAERRLAAAQAEATAKQERATVAIRAAIAATQANSASRRADAAAAFGGTIVADGQEMSAKQRLIAALRAIVPLRGQARSALAGETTETNKNTAAVNRNSAAKKQATTNLALFSDVGRKSLGTYQRLRGQILGLTAAYVGFYQVINTAQKAIQATNRNQSLMIGLRTINDGSAAGAAADYSYLRKEAEKLGLVFDDMAPQFANVASAGQALGMNATQIRDLFSNTATAAAAMNLSVEDSEGVFRALTQIMSKGKVQAEELRGQLGDRLPGAVAIMAKANGMALSELDKRLEKGTLGIDFIIRGMEAYAKRYDKEMDNVSGRLQAYINNAKNAYNDFLRSLLTGANDQKLKDAFARIEGFFKSKEGQQFASGLATAFGKAIDGAIWLANNIKLVSLAVQALLAWNLLKFLNDTIIGVVALGGHFKTAAIFVTGYNAKARIAAVGTATLSARMKGLAIAMGPIIGIVTGLSLGILTYINRSKQAAQSTRDFENALNDLSNARTADEIEGAAYGAKEEVKRLREEIEGLEGLKVGGLEGLKNSLTLDLREPETLRTGADVDAAILKRREQLAKATQTLILKDLELYALRDEEAAKAAKERAAPLPGGPTGEDGGKDGSKSAMREANARANAARSIQKELLDLDQKIFDARTHGEIRTAQQVQENYSLRIQTIESEIAEGYLKIEQLEQAARTANSGALPAEEAAALQVARERLEQLRLTLNTKAMEVSETQDIEVLERRINDLIDQRAARIAHVNALKEAGLLGEVDAYNEINATQDAYTQRIREQVAEIMPLLQAIATNNEDPRQSWAKALIADFDLLLIKQRQYTMGQRIIMQLGDQFASGAADAMVQLGKGIAGAIQGTNSLGDAFKSARDAFLNFAADFLQQIAQMIMQAIILQAIKNAISGGTGGYWQAAMGALAGSNHTGGLVGGAGSGPKRRVNPAVFAGAQRFHTGGLPGLRSGEVATILKRGEEVLPEDNPRHVANAGGGGVNIDMVNTFDSAAVVSAGLRSGRKTIVNDLTSAIRANRNEFKTALGIG